ncbi:MAG TPA: DUF5050 domain-containing protein, partial [Anaerolineales bacterium]|nr:DUF5050 domain-containing protein [Anaerolineales bacterium]
QIQEEEPGFEDTERLLARVEAEIAKQEARRQLQERVETLHEQAISLSRARQWRQALEKVKEIESLDPEFADPDEIAAKAEAEIAREEGETQRQNETAALYAEAVRLLKAGQYQEALDKWGEVQALNPDYLDRHEVQSTARKKLEGRSQPITLGVGHSRWAKVLLAGAILAGILAGIFMLNRGLAGEIIFTSNRDGDWEIYKMRSDGTGLSKLTNNSAGDRQSSTSKAGRIVFTSNRDGNAEIYVMNADGSQQTNLTNSPAADYEPVWSPDGKRIAFVSRVGEGGEVYVMNADGSQQINLSNHEANDFGPAWSPDGQQIAFVSNRYGSHKIFVVDTKDGSDLHPLIEQPFEQFTPCWSLDGRITFGSAQDKRYIVQKDGKGLEEFVNIQNECWTQWSPDRRWIIWADLNIPPNWEIYLINPGTGKMENLTNSANDDQYPSWLP